jgi:hypothetical protein
LDAAYDSIKGGKNNVLLNACKVIGLTVNTWITKYMEMGRDMIANEHIRIGSNFYGKLKTFQYLGSLVTINLTIFSTVR